jgi:hypothetical protein
MMIYIKLITSNRVCKFKIDCLKLIVGILCLIGLFLCFILFSCKSSNKTESSQNSIYSGHRQEENAVKSNDSLSFISNEQSEAISDTWIYRREYYPSIRGDTFSPDLKSETWSGTNAKINAKKNIQANANTSIESDSKSEENDNVELSKNEKKAIVSDKRPIQGIEWMWVFVGIGIVIVVLIFVFWKKIFK